ncbi:MAG: AAA family ATPase [Candidatus Nanopelagicales bacterium]
MLTGEILAPAARLRDNLNKILSGKPLAVDAALTVLVAGGHLLIEDVPGVGKTLLAKALGRSIGGSVARIQFTPDLLPADVTGVSVFNQQHHTFEFRPGPVFANIVLADEVNRASPKTQSALLEAMAEHQVSVDGSTYALPDPFLVIATQNPIEMDGTYALPEAQRDRFMARISMGYPDPAAELRMLREHSADQPLDDLREVASAEDVIAMRHAAGQVFVAEPVLALAVQISNATRNTSQLRLGASPRATLHLIRAARARAALAGREHVLPDDVLLLASAILSHRLLVSTQSAASGVTADAVLAGLLGRLPAARP